jgi:bifunctional DNase/RNase
MPEEPPEDHGETQPEGPYEGDDAGLELPPPFFPYGNRDGREPELGALVEVDVEGVFAAESDGQAKSLFVLLSSNDRRLPIVIGPYEAQAISLPLDNAQPDRPMTHDLLRTVIERLDGSVDRIVIDDLWNGTYYAKLYLKSSQGELEVDTRPSDAIALAVRFGAPVFVAEGLLEIDLDN